MTFNVLNPFNQYNETTITGQPWINQFRCSAMRVLCGLRIAFVASECPRMSSLCSARAAVGCVLPSSHPNTEEFRCSAARAPLWAAHCLCGIGMPKNVVAPQCVRRCGARIAFVASERLRRKNFVALQRVRRCGLRIAFVASECRRMSLRC